MFFIMVRVVSVAGAPTSLQSTLQRNVFVCVCVCVCVCVFVWERERERFVCEGCDSIKVFWLGRGCFLFSPAVVCELYICVCVCVCVCERDNCIKCSVFTSPAVVCELYICVCVC